MVTVAIRALELEYLVKILDWGRSRSRYIFFRLRLHSSAYSNKENELLTEMTATKLIFAHVILCRSHVTTFIQVDQKLSNIRSKIN
jgi:hypothetical protein